MGDHRVSIKINFSMHELEEEIDAYWNWSDDIPERIAGWILAKKEIAMERYLSKQYKQEDRDKAEQENQERVLLARLKSKYEGGLP